MTDLDKLRSVKTVIAHKSCADGTAAAMIAVRALKALGANPEVKFVQYDTKEQHELPAWPNQLFVDITPPLKRWWDWADLDPIVLDHHDTAEAVTAGLGGVYGYPEESGATLAFRHVMMPVVKHLSGSGGSVSAAGHEKWAEFAHLCRVRDTWQDKHPDFTAGQGVAHGLSFYGSKDMVQAAREDAVDFDRVRAVGSELYAKLLWKAGVYADSAHLFEAERGGRTYKFGVFNCSEKATSEAAHILLDRGCDVAVGYFMLFQDDSVCYSVSLRSHKGGVLVNKMAEQLGGGGHPPAAGFRVTDALGKSLQDLCDIVVGALPE